MFSGIVETTGTTKLVQTENNVLRIDITPTINFADCAIGDSISVNGVCLTITKAQNNTFSFDIIPETSRLTNIKHLALGSEVNLERSLSLNARISGHFVQGHIDNTAKIIKICNKQHEYNITFLAGGDICSALIKKGFIAIDGMSLTLTDVSNNYFSVSFIPYTIKNTIARNYTVGNEVNIEIDITSKSILKYLKTMELNNV